jgi:hypothetical protein
VVEVMEFSTEGSIMYLTTIAAANAVQVNPKARKPGKRKANGRLRNPTAKEREEAAQKKARVELERATGQPHRRGKKDPDSEMWGSAIGTFVKTHGYREELYRAGLQFKTIVCNIRSADLTPTDEHLGGGGGGEIDPKTVAGWKATRKRIERALKGMDHRGGHLRAAELLCIHERSLGPDEYRYGQAALMTIAEELGYKLHGHPFAVDRS